MILVTHDLGLVAETSQRIAVMYSGRIAEVAGVDALFPRPSHPYTLGLLESLPSLEDVRDELRAIPGQPPDMARRPPGCAFHPRCPLGRDRTPCREVYPPLSRVGEDHASALPLCQRGRERRHLERRGGAMTEAALEVEGLRKDFPVRRRSGWGYRPLCAVDDVSFAIPPGKTLGLVGESGCGKSTLGRTIVGLVQPTAGTIRSAAALSAGGGVRRTCGAYRWSSRDPYSSLDPRMTIHDVVAEPLRINGVYRRTRVDQLLDQVGLSGDAGARRPRSSRAGSDSGSPSPGPSPSTLRC